MQYSNLKVPQNFVFCRLKFRLSNNGLVKPRDIYFDSCRILPQSQIPSLSLVCYVMSQTACPRVRALQVFCHWIYCSFTALTSIMFSKTSTTRLFFIRFKNFSNCMSYYLKDLSFICIKRITKCCIGYGKELLHFFKNNLDASLKISRSDWLSL